MPSTSFYYPVTVANDASYGVTAWFIDTPGGGGALNTDCAIDKTESNYLKCTNYGISLPTASVISGIEVSLVCSTVGSAASILVRLVKGGTVTGTAKTAATFTTATFGGDLDMWGATLSEADVEDSGFGLVISGSGAFNGTNISVSRADIKIHYGTGGDIVPSSSTSGHFLLSWMI